MRCIGAIAAAGLAACGALAQPTDPSLNNFAHAPGTATCEPGTLGGVVKRGTGEIDLVLIAGAPFGAEAWAGFMERNADRYTMYAITPAGYEATAPPPFSGDPEFDDMAWTEGLLSAVAGLIEREGIRPIVVGHHLMGGYYALRLALDHPDAIAGVVAADTQVCLPMPALSRAVGDPARYASAQERFALVTQQYAPFYRTVTDEMWRKGTYGASMLSVDGARGQALYDEQVSVPISTQIGYFMEYMHTDLTGRLGELRAPLLVIEGERDLATVEAMVDLQLPMYEAFYGTRDAAIAGARGQLQAAWGSVENGLAWSVNKSGQWERAQEAVADMRLEYVDSTGFFVMQDRPERFDELIWTFAQHAAQR